MILIRILYTVALMLIISISSFAQSLSGSLTLNPYPSPYVSDWENNPSALGSLTIFQNGGRSFQIKIRAVVSMQGRGEVFRSITNPIDISAAPVQIITNTTLISLSDASFADKDYERKMRFTGRLLEGYYTACLTIENLTGVILANNICSNFTILYPSAPQLIFPVNNDSLESNTNYPTFQWIPVITPPAYQIKYNLRIVEILQSQTQDQAINSNIPLYENNQILINSFTYPIEALPIEEGKKYAWQVQALDQFGISPTQNQGRSEIFTFVKKKKFNFPIFLFTNVLLSTPANSLTINSKKPEFKWIYSPAQGLNIKYNIRVAPVLYPQTSNEQALNNTPVYNQIVNSNTNSFTPINDINFINDKEYVWQVTVLNANTNAVLNKSVIWKFKYKVQQQIVVGGIGNIPAYSSVSGTLDYKYAYQYDTQHWALANKTVKLVVKYVMDVKSTSSNVKSGGASIEDPKSSLILTYDQAIKFGNDPNKVLDVKVTDANGNFKFSFINPDSMKIIKKDAEVYSGGGLNYKGDIYRVARVIVDDPYYTSPDNNIFIQPWGNINTGLLTSLIRSYTLEVTMKPAAGEQYESQYTHQDLEQMDVYLLRKFRPAGLPSNEGDPKPGVPETIFGYEVIAKGTTQGEGSMDGKGKIIFNRLITNINPNDKYYLSAKSNENASHNYAMGVLKFTFSYGYGTEKFNFTSNDGVNYKYNPPQSGAINYSQGDKSVFNSEYTYPIVHYNAYATPLMPIVKGRVVRSDDPGTPVGGAKVLLFKRKSSSNWLGQTSYSWVVEREKIVPATGYFEFSYLNVEYSQQSPYPVNGPIRKILATAQGFQSSGYVPINGQAGGALALGEKVKLKDTELNPGALVTGKISDDLGSGIWAKIKIGNSPEKSVKPASMYMDPKTKKFVITPGSFKIPAAKLNHQPVIITPDYNTSSYILDTLYKDINQNNQDLGTLKVYRKLHRMKFIVKEAQPWVPSINQPTPPVYQWPVLPGAKVKIQLLGSWVEEIANQFGEVNFEYSSDSDSFKVVIEGPKGKYYVKKVFSIYNKPSKYQKVSVIALEKATYISGSVYVAGTQPVQGADVWIDFGNPDLNISIKTDEIGEYILPNVPIGANVIVYGSKHSDEETIIGDSSTVLTTASGKTGVDLFLTIYNGMDITKLLGFPIQLNALQELNNGEVKITGVFKQFKKNDYFSVFDSTTAQLKIANVFVKPGTKLNSKGIPYAVLVEPSITVDNPTFELKAFQKFKCTVSNTTDGIKLADLGNDNGVIKGKAFVGASEFDTKGSMDGYSGLYLSDPTAVQNKIVIPTITAEGNKPLQLPKGFIIMDVNGNGLSFKINKFDASADPNNSFFNYDTVRLRTTLKTNIKNAVPSNLNLQIGDVVFHQIGIDPIVGDKEFTFKLDNWNLIANKWFFNQGNIKISEGTLKTGADIPIISLDITPTTFTSGYFDFQSMLVSGIVPIKITGKTIFGYDQSTNWWYLSVSKNNQSDSYAASFQNLPGMNPNDLIKLNSFVMNSKNSFFTLNPIQQTIKLYKVGILKLNSSALLAYNNYLQIPGLTFNIPKVTASTSVQYFKGSNGKIAFKMKGININTDAGNGVYIQFGVDESQANSQVLDENGFRSRGMVGEEGKFKLFNWLFHKENSTEIIVETPQTPFTYSQNFQRLDIGKANTTYLNKMTGGMKPKDAYNWNSYHFEGFIEGSKSVGFKDNQNKLNFTVEGEIVANNQTLGVKNVDTPFGKMEWFYDFEKNQLRGSVNVDVNLQNQVFLNGTAETIVDGDGWYFFGGLNMGMANPHLQGTAGVLFGNYPMTQSIKTTFSKYSGFYKQAKKLPPNFPASVSGFFFEGEVEIPVPIFPDFDFNFGLVSAHLSKYIGCDIRLGMQFAETNKYSVGADIFAKINAGVGGTIGVACATLSATACAAVSLNGEYYSNGDWSAEGYGGVTLTGSTEVGWGACDSDCDGIDNPFGDGDTCSTDSEDASIGIGISGKYGTLGKWIHIQWGSGGPSICN